MNFTVSVLRHPRQVSLVAMGRADLAELCGMCSLAQEVGRLRGHRQLIIDVLALVPEITDAERVELGRHLAATLKTFEKIAWVYHPDRHSGIAQKIAIAQGVHVRVFDRLEAATQWLSAPAETGPRDP
jgi:hypothetical protein